VILRVQAVSEVAIAHFFLDRYDVNNLSSYFYSYFFCSGGLKYYRLRQKANGDAATASRYYGIPDAFFSILPRAAARQSYLKRRSGRNSDKAKQFILSKLC